MFFKISLGSIITLVIVVCVYMGTSAKSAPLILKSEEVVGHTQEPRLAESHTQMNPGCKSYIMTVKGKICIEPGIPIEYENYSSTIPEKHSEGRGTASLDTSDDTFFSVPVPPNDTEKGEFAEAQNIEPGTIFIPFFFKSCTWFCE